MGAILFDEADLPMESLYTTCDYLTISWSEDLKREGWDDKAMSCYVPYRHVVLLYEHSGFSGRSSVLDPGYHPNAEAMGIPVKSLSSLRTLPYTEGRPLLTLFEHADYRGDMRNFFENTGARSLKISRFNDCTTSIIVSIGTWELFEHSDYRGKRWVLKPGRYRNSGAAGIDNDKISSVRLIE